MYKGLHVKDVHSACVQFLDLHDFVEEMRNGKDPDEIFAKYESSLREMFRHIEDSEEFAQALYDHMEGPSDETPENIRLLNRAALSLYDNIHGHSGNSRKAITKFITKPLFLSLERSTVMGLVEGPFTEAFERLEEDMKPFAWISTTAVQGISEEEATETITFDSSLSVSGATPSQFVVPHVVLMDSNRRIPELSIRDGEERTVFPVIPDGVDVDENPEVLSRFQGISDYCERSAKKKKMSNRMKQELFKNLLLLCTQSLGTGAAGSISLATIPLQEHATQLAHFALSHTEHGAGRSIQLEWNEEGYYDIVLHQTSILVANVATSDAHDGIPPVTINTRWIFISTNPFSTDPNGRTVEVGWT